MALSLAGVEWAFLAPVSAPPPRGTGTPAPPRRTQGKGNDAGAGARGAHFYVAGGVASWDARGLQVLPLAKLETAGAADLRTLSVSRNALEEIPERIGNAALFPRLRRIVANSNRIRVVPASLANLASSLEELWLNDNLIAALPCALGRLVDAHTVSVEGNPLSARAAPGADVALSDVWHGEEGSRDGVRRRTRRLLEHLRCFMEPDARAEAERLLQTKRRKAAAAAARDALVAGDRAALADALAAAAAAGEAESTLASVRSDVRALATLEDAASTVELRAALEHWAARVPGATVLEKDGLVRVSPAAKGAVASGIAAHNRCVRDAHAKARREAAAAAAAAAASAQPAAAQARADVGPPADEPEEPSGAWAAWLERKRSDSARRHEEVLAYRARVRSARSACARDALAHRAALAARESNWADVLARPAGFYAKKPPARRARAPSGGAPSPPS